MKPEEMTLEDKLAWELADLVECLLQTRVDGPERTEKAREALKEYRESRNNQ